ncbi:2-amino-4-hydroxy-6-hydroxymethyldihydropteridine diphosphokinase [Vibrio parahaemolyticus]|uniref:2-amino-4-hydroxy-6- hydroxymethyldihydropteridine diphosphokinase n=1 Tax=Vibrio parahaemolyticus TaxID=670 RepID=UPI001299A5D8|nr:2-amino-4-hydroxy-6-hydroxymethyldihydropteridine diphosphokinase [Vibrio parahaemolyticus]EJB8571679.1 2-amino-4-hydroxy-6-hydroxymethyldihydropteridine diphosphokinase [Vibrio parahaemolyticus]ELB2950473.1 2-amino-4-hydroxy-6-hydroxymethyldihydropteridine diphosphokinase [Vibrio parahaemolyticus]MCZ6380260.1 2-amino-4-hydroxy-6-hydroxymethyldihydropteridine diphosphokinase [Vibrio parahaemolyticus]MRD91553.1 2-amino-4-hydroxy-6-hydroxymethyldihydropteridine diphosphokinase [Vibrio parahaem
MITAYIAVGSNLADPVSQAQQAIEALKTLTNSEFVQASSLYSSTPMGPQNQPDYINAVVAIKTNLTPLELLDCTQAIEQEQGRVRKDERWGPRTLDLDIVLYGNEVINSERLIVPHYGMREREFVLYPLAEIAPSLQLPDGTEVSELLEQVDRNGLRIWQS